MRNLKLMLQREPAAIGTVVASIMPVLVLLGVVRIDEAGIAAVVVAVNAIVGLLVRVTVSPVNAPVGALAAGVQPTSAGTAGPASVSVQS